MSVYKAIQELASLREWFRNNNDAFYRTSEEASEKRIYTLERGAERIGEIIMLLTANQDVPFQERSLDDHTKTIRALVSYNEDAQFNHWAHDPWFNNCKTLLARIEELERPSEVTP